MSQMEDLAQQTLKRFAEIWGLDKSRAAWIQPTAGVARGFDWWPGDFRVQVRLHMPEQRAPGDEIRINIQTDFLKGVALGSERFVEMVATLPRHWTSTYAWTYLPQEAWQRWMPASETPFLRFDSTGYVTKENIHWMPSFLACATVLQPINAHLHAHRIGELLGAGEPNISHPSGLPEANLNEMLQMINDMYGASEPGPSRWAGTGEFEEFAAKWGKSDYCFAMGDPTGMAIDIPFGDSTARIRLDTREKHAQLGRGLLATVKLPYGETRLAFAKTAAELNMLEAIKWTSFPQLGCWHVNDNGRGEDRLGFVMFLPDNLYFPGMVTPIADWLVRRAYWARDTLFPDMKHDVLMDILMRQIDRWRNGSMGTER